MLPKGLWNLFWCEDQAAFSLPQAPSAAFFVILGPPKVCVYQSPFGWPSHRHSWFHATLSLFIFMDSSMQKSVERGFVVQPWSPHPVLFHLHIVCQK